MLEADHPGAALCDTLGSPVGQAEATPLAVIQQLDAVYVDIKQPALALSPADVSAAIAAQNVQFASGRIGDLPSPPTQQISATLIAEGQLTTPEDFGAIVLRAKPDRSRWCRSG